MITVSVITLCRFNCVRLQFRCFCWGAVIVWWFICLFALCQYLNWFNLKLIKVNFVFIYTLLLVSFSKKIIMLSSFGCNSTPNGWKAPKKTLIIVVLLVCFPWRNVKKIHQRHCMKIVNKTSGANGPSLHLKHQHGLH